MRKVVSKRVMVTLPDEVATTLEQWANQQGRPTANLAAYLIEDSVREALEKGQIKSPA